MNRLPSPEPPTGHPSYNLNRHPKINVFAVMPYSKLADVDQGSVVDLNVATYFDPITEPGWLIAAKRYPRWMQGLPVTIDDISDVDVTKFPQYGVSHSIDVEHRVFSGKAVHYDAEIPIVGAAHPRKYGWLALEADVAGESKLSTIAGLKALMGKISVEQAQVHTARFNRTRLFELNGVEYS